MGWAWPRRGVRVIAGPPEVATRLVRIYTHTCAGVQMF